MGRRIVLFLLMVFLAACAATPEPSATPPVVQRLATTPELEAIVASWLTDYNTQFERGSLHLENLSRDLLLSSLNSGNVALAILGEQPPEDWFATPLVKEAFVVIVNPEIPIQSLSILDLEELFSGRIRTWETLANVEDSVQLVIPFKGDIFRERFDQVIMKGSIFDPSSLVTSTADVTLEFVRSKSGAIGFIPADQLEDCVRVVEIDGVAPGEGAINSDQYPLWVDIIATSPQEPAGSLRDFLVWLQETYLPAK